VRIPPFVGRDGELDAVVTAVAQVTHAGLTAVVISGEAGIGKSRLLAEAADAIDRHGWRMLPVRADGLERHVPYAALAAAIQELAVDSTFAEGLRREALAALDLPVEPGSAGAAFGRACAGMSRLLTALAAGGPLVVTIDDLHQLDDDSLALLAVVLNRLAAVPIGLVVAMRTHAAESNPAAEELLRRLEDRADVVGIELDMLSPEHLAVVVAGTLGAAPDQALADEVCRRSDGNPYFATEIAQSLLDSHLVVVDAAGARLSGPAEQLHLSRRSAVLRRVLPLSSQARTVARVMAVLRRAALSRIGLIAEVTGLTDAQIATAFDDLVRARVVVAGPDLTYRFTHDIVGDALYDEIGPAECRRLHRLCAERLLVDQYGHDLLELAWHLSESAAPGDVRAAEVLTRAARFTLSAAPEAAAGFCERALSLLDETAPERAGLLALRCRAQARASRPAAAAVSGREALALLPPGEERYRTAVAVLGSLLSLGRINDGIAVADEQVGAVDVPAALRAQRALLLVFANRTAEALREADVAASTPPRSPAEEVVVYGQLAMLTSMLFDHAETVRYADLALDRAGSSVTLQLQALGVAAFTEALAGLIAGASRRVRHAEKLTRQNGGPHPFDAELAVARIVIDWMRGRWDQALEAVRTIAVDLAARQHVTIAGALTSVELEMRTWRGELALAQPLARAGAQLPRNMASLHAWALAGYQSARGEADAARTTLRTATEAPGTPVYIGLLLSRLAELELSQGHPDQAEAAVRLLVGAPTSDLSPWANTTLHRTVGAVRGDVDAMREAIRDAESEGLVFERARAQLAFAGLATQPDTDGLVEAHQTFAHLGTHGLRRLAAAQLRQLGAKVPRVRSRAAGLLTESEERVARLVQQGMRNREIAAALHFSPRSIEVYLSRIYAKLRVSSRLELARALDAMDPPT